jgi:hypothetical protein
MLYCTIVPDDFVRMVIIVNLLQQALILAHAATFSILEAFPETNIISGRLSYVTKEHASRVRIC